jgi:tRNA(Arg) A34 adenosine deaminase TadA
MPEWYPDWIATASEDKSSLESRMRLVCDAARMNFERGTGGPFAAAVFERATAKLLSIGVNRVVQENMSSAHAEVMALSLAQRIRGTWDLGAPGAGATQLVVNWRPCIMCMGAVIWSGVTELVIAGAGPELEDLTGFDEGPVPADWRAELDRRGIHTVTDICREEAVTLFRDFASSRSLVYNARQGATAQPIDGGS